MGSLSSTRTSFRGWRSRPGSTASPGPSARWSWRSPPELWDWDDLRLEIGWDGKMMRLRCQTVETSVRRTQARIVSIGRLATWKHFNWLPNTLIGPRFLNIFFKSWRVSHTSLPWALKRVAMLERKAACRVPRLGTLQLDPFFSIWGGSRSSWSGSSRGWSRRYISK